MTDAETKSLAQDSTPGYRPGNPAYVPATAAEQQRQDLVSRLSEHPFIHGLNLKYLATLADCATDANFPAGEQIFKEGDLANRFYLIETGRVQLETHVRDKGEVPIQVIGAGDVLGWSWLFPPYYWHFDARAIEPVKAIFLYGSRLLVHCEDDPELGYAMMKKMAAVLIGRLQATRKELLKTRHRLHE